MKLWLWRHARVILPDGLCYGASNVAADPLHTQQVAQQAACLLPMGLPVRVSGLGRAQQLARALSTCRPDLALPVIDDRLNEMDFGQWELQPWTAIARPAFDAWMADFAHHRFGGRESTQQLIDRVADALEAQRRAAVPHALWITHAGVIRAVRFIRLHGRGPIQRADQWPCEAPEPGGYGCEIW